MVTSAATGYHSEKMALVKSLFSPHYQRSMMNRFLMDMTRGVSAVISCHGRLEENYPMDNFWSTTSVRGRSFGKRYEKR